MGVDYWSEAQRSMSDRTTAHKIWLNFSWDVANLELRPPNYALLITPSLSHFNCCWTKLREEYSSEGLHKFY